MYWQPVIRGVIDDYNDRVERENTPPVITRAEFDRNKIGMTYDEVVEIIGTEGDSDRKENSLRVLYSWTNRFVYDGAFIEVEDGRMIDKEWRPPH